MAHIVATDTVATFNGIVLLEEIILYTKDANKLATYTSCYGLKRCVMRRQNHNQQDIELLLAGLISKSFFQSHIELFIQCHCLK